MSIKNLKTLNAWLAEQLAATTHVAVLREGTVPARGTVRSKVKCRSQLTVISINDVLDFEDELSLSKKVSELKLELSKFVKVGGAEIAPNEFIDFYDERVAHGRRNWRASAARPSPRAPYSAFAEKFDFDGEEAFPEQHGEDGFSGDKVVTGDDQGTFPIVVIKSRWGESNMSVRPLFELLGFPINS